MDAVFGIQPERRIRPTAEHLAGADHLNLITQNGNLDLLGTIGRDFTYSDLPPHSASMEIGDSIRVQVLELETLIAIKEKLGGEKDRAVLPVLRRTLAEKRKAMTAPLCRRDTSFE